MKMQKATTKNLYIDLTKRWIQTSKDTGNKRYNEDWGIFIFLIAFLSTFWLTTHPVQLTAWRIKRCPNIKFRIVYNVTQILVFTWYFPFKIEESLANLKSVFMSKDRYKNVLWGNILKIAFFTSCIQWSSSSVTSISSLSLS